MTDQQLGSTTGAGAPAASDRNSLSIGANGPILLHDTHFLEQMAHFNRERVPERSPHAKGSGAFGVLEVTEDVSQYTKAALFQKGARTEMLARFSTVAGEQGSPDTWRDVRGYSLKFYTSEGNYDIVGNNTPIFFLRDPIKFPHFIRSQKRLPDSGLRSNQMQWDFWTLNPESAHQVTYVMGQRGLPRTWRHMNGYGSHTYMWINAAAEKFWVKYHFHTNQGMEFLTNQEAARITGEDADFHRRDLFEAIERGDFPSWKVSVQVMPYAAAKDYRFNPFDLTKVWPHKDYPLIRVGTYTLNKNPENFFAQIEQAAFSPGNTVPGIRAPDMTAAVKSPGRG
jgi:catalase